MNKERDVTVFGIFGITLGAILLFFYGSVFFAKFLPFFYRFPDVTTGYLGLFKNTILFVWAIVLLFNIYFIAGGIGVLKRKIWGRRAFLNIASILVIVSVGWYLALGSLVNVKGLILNSFLIILIYLFFNIPAIKEVFSLSDEHCRKERRLYAGVYVSVILLVVVYFCVRVQLKARYPYIFQAPQHIQCQSEKFFALRDKNYVKRQIFGKNVYLPAQLCVSGLTRTPSSKMIVFMRNPQKTVFLSAVDDALAYAFKVYGGRFGFSQPYDFFTRVINDNVGIFPLAVNILLGDMKDIKSDSWKGFFKERMDAQRGVNIYSYYLWHKHDSSGLEMTFIVKNDVLAEPEITAMVSSLDISLPLMTDKEYFDQGKALLQQNNYENAKFEFCSALSLQPDNAQYYYYFAKAFAGTQDYKTAKNYLSEAIARQTDYPEVQQLLGEMELKNK